MKKLVLVLMMSSSMLLADMLGYVGAGYSRGDEGSNMVTAFGAMNVFGSIALRLEYTKNIDEHSAFSKENVTRYGAFLTYSLPVAPYLELMPKIGLIKSDGEWTLKDGLKKVSDSDTKFTYGLELDYFVNAKFSIFAGYNDYGYRLKIHNIKSSQFDQANYIVGVKLHI